MDKIQLLVLEVVQRHRLPVQKYRLYIEVIEYLKFLLADIPAQVAPMQASKLPKRYTLSYPRKTISLGRL